MAIAKVNFSELRKYKKELEQFSGTGVDDMINQCAHVIAEQLLTLTQGRTPVVTGNLRHGWSTEVTKQGNVYRITIANPVEYASYVEYGHSQTPGRFVPAIGKRLVSAWVNGKFMMSISVREVAGKAPSYVETYVARKLKEALK